MQMQWRNPETWVAIGADAKVPPPRLPKREPVRVRSLGGFCMDGQAVEQGEIVAVDPDDTLRAHAESKGWPVISLR